MSMHALHRKCCTRISSRSRSKSCAYYAFMQFATNIQYKHVLQRKKHTSIKVQKPYLKCCCKSCAWNRCYCFNVRRMHLELRVYHKPYCRMHAVLHCFNLCHAFYLAMQHHLDCVHPSGKRADSRSTYITNVLHVLFVATINAVCLMLSRDVRLQVLS